MTTARTTFVGEFGNALHASLQRRSFIRIAALSGIGVMATSLLTACDDNPADPSLHSDIDFSTPSGALNLLLATAQLQADFFTRVVLNPYVGMTTAESNSFALSRDRNEALVTALSNIIHKDRLTTALLFDFSTVDFSSKSTVLPLAQQFEDLSIQLVNGCIPLAQDPDAALCLAKAGSIFARQSSIIRFQLDLPTLGSTQFASGLTEQALFPARTPAEWYAATKQYFKTTLTIAQT